MYSAKHIICIAIYKEFNEKKKTTTKKQAKLLEVLLNIHVYCQIVSEETEVKKFVLDQKYCKSGKSDPVWPDPRSVELITTQVNL